MLEGLEQPERPQHPNERDHLDRLACLQTQYGFPVDSGFLSQLLLGEVLLKPATREATT